jgi:ribosomal protein L29
MASKPLNAQDVRALTPEQIQAELKSARGSLVQLRMKRASEKIEDNSQFVKLRRTVARLKTEITARNKPRAAGKVSSKS